MLAARLTAVVALALGPGGCSTVIETSPGITVDVVSESAAGWQGQGQGQEQGQGQGQDSWTVVNDRGEEVRVLRGFLVTSSLELLPCVSGAWLRGWLGVRRAEAHPVATPTLLAAAQVEPLAGPRALLELGAIRPPPSRYCQARYVAGPADADAAGLPTSLRLVGRSLYVEGTVGRPGQVPQAFLAWSENTLAADVPLPGLVLSAAAPRATLRLRKSAAHWFDGLDLAQGSPRALGDALLARIAGSIAVEAAQ